MVYKFSMGATTFYTVVNGKTPEDAFNKAREEAEGTYGLDDGCTGTILEKTSFKVIPMPKGENPELNAQSLIEKDDPRIGGVRGPAGCIAFAKKAAVNAYLFFGWAAESGNDVP